MSTTLVIFRYQSPMFLSGGIRTFTPPIISEAAVLAERGRDGPGLAGWTGIPSIAKLGFTYPLNECMKITDTLW